MRLWDVCEECGSPMVVREVIDCGYSVRTDEMEYHFMSVAVGVWGMSSFLAGCVSFRESQNGRIDEVGIHCRV